MIGVNDFTIESGGLVNGGDGSWIRISGNWTSSDGTFDSSGGIFVDFTGPFGVQQNLGVGATNTTFTGITHSGAGSLGMDGDITVTTDFVNSDGVFYTNGFYPTVNGNFANTGDAVFELDSGIVVNGNVTIEHNSILNAINGVYITVKGNWTNLGSLTGQSTVTFNGTTILSDSSGGLKAIVVTGTVALGADFGFDATDGSISGEGSLSLGLNHNLTLSGFNNQPLDVANFDGGTGTSTVFYNLTTDYDQITFQATGAIYNNLTLSGSVPYSPDGDLTAANGSGILGDFTNNAILFGGTFEVGGSWINNGYNDPVSLTLTGSKTGKFIKGNGSDGVFGGFHITGSGEWTMQGELDFPGDTPATFSDGNLIMDNNSLNITSGIIIDGGKITGSSEEGSFLNNDGGGFTINSGEFVAPKDVRIVGTYLHSGGSTDWTTKNSTLTWDNSGVGGLDIPPDEYNNLTLQSGGGGLFNFYNGETKIRGDLITGASIDAPQGTINFNRPDGIQTVTDSDYFNNVIHSGAGTLRINASNSIGFLVNNITNPSGPFDASGRNIFVSGNWNFANGTYSAGGTPGDQLVWFIGSGIHTISGNNTFNNLKINDQNFTSEVDFASGSTQTINGSLTLIGNAGGHLTLGRSGGSGSDQWNLVLPGNMTLDSNAYVTVSNSHVSGGEIMAIGNHIVDGGNNSGWVFALTPPVSAINTPATGANVGAGTVQVTGTTTSSVGNVTKVEVRVNSGAWRDATNTGTNFSTWVYDTNLSSSGDYDIRSRATSSYDIVEVPSTSITIHVSAGIPSVKVTKPAQGEWVTSSSYDVTGTTTTASGTTISKVEVTFDGTNWANAVNTGTNFSSWKYTLANLADGHYTLKARATDSGGAVSALYSTVFGIDQTAPGKPGSFSTFNVSNHIAGTSQALLWWQASTDATSGIKEYQIFRGITQIGTTTNNYYIDESPVSGKYQIKVIDKAGNSISSDESTLDLAVVSSKLAISDVKSTPSALLDVNGKTSALISWKTDQPSTSLVYYGLGGAKANQAGIDNQLNFSHFVILTNLDPNTTYHFAVASRDILGQDTTSADQIFTSVSNAASDTAWSKVIKTFRRSFEWFKKAMASPILEKLGILRTPEQISPQMTVFNVSVPAANSYQSFISYSGNKDFTLERSTDGKSFTQLAKVTDANYYFDQNLTADTTYYYRAKDMPGLVSFRTSGTDTAPPVISNLATKVLGQDQKRVEVVISYRTDKMSTTEVNINDKTYQDESLNQTHLVLIDNLKPSQPYGYNVKSADTNGAVATAEGSITAQTISTPESTWQSITNTMENKFNRFANWMRK